MLKGVDLWHITNRGVEGRDIFLDSRDYARMVHNLFAFNDAHDAAAYERRNDVGFPKPYVRERLVDIHGWVLMRNHYHVLLSETADGGLVRFLRKLNIGYANYFNERYTRKGTLFQGKTKKVRIESDAHFLYVLHYIHLNPLDYLPGAKKWRERDKGDIRNVAESISYLKKYRWSSFLDYCGVKNFPSLITTELFKDVFGNYERDIHEYLADHAEELTVYRSLEY